MTNTSGTTVAEHWQAEIITEQRCVPMKEQTTSGNSAITFRKVKVPHVVIAKPGYGHISFRVNRRRDRSLTFTDSREENSARAVRLVYGVRGCQASAAEDDRLPPRPLSRKCRG